MKMVLRLEEHEKAAIATVLDMFNHASNEILDVIDQDNNTGVISDDVVAYLEDFYNRYA